MVRNLIYVPLVHNAFSSEIVMTPELEEILGRIDSNLKEEFKAEQESYWNNVDQCLSRFKIDRVYQDTVTDNPSPKRLMPKIRELALKSRNLRTVCSLIDKGAILMPTEKFEFLYQLENPIKVQIRDRYIAGNIEKTLRDNETAALFMGLMHKVDKVLSAGYPSITVLPVASDIKHLTEVFLQMYKQADPDDSEELLKLIEVCQ